MSIYSNLILQDSEENLNRLKLGILEPNLMQVLDESRVIKWAEPMDLTDFYSLQKLVFEAAPFFIFRIDFVCFQPESRGKKKAIIVILGHIGYPVRLVFPKKLSQSMIVC